jgi:dienelactone hydrolase
MEADSLLPGHTLYHPADLSSPGSAKLPIVVWGNGACRNTGNRFRWFLTDISSYGYLIVAIGPIDPDPNQEMAPVVAPAAPAAPPAPGGTFTPATRTAQLLEGLSWAITENDRAGSKYFHKLDTAKIGVMGQSCGGLQAIEASADPRVTTSIFWNTGLIPTPGRMAGGKELSKEDLKLLHGPVALISGDAQDIAFENANDDFDKITTVPAFRAYERGVPHTGTYWDRNGGEFAGVAVAWLNWQLKGDTRSALMFVGNDCGLCVNPKWVVQKKGMR